MWRGVSFPKNRAGVEEEEGEGEGDSGREQVAGWPGRGKGALAREPGASRPIVGGVPSSELAPEGLRSARTRGRRLPRSPGNIGWWCGLCGAGASPRGLGRTHARIRPKAPWRDYP